MNIYTPDAIAEMQRIASDPDACSVCGCHRWAPTQAGDGLVCAVCHPGPGDWYATRAEAESRLQPATVETPGRTPARKRAR